MKNERHLKAMLLAICMLIFATTSLRASSIVSNEKISKKVRNRMTYPHGLIPKSDEAVVLVSFHVEPCGTVSILNVNASDESFKEYVVQKISTMQFEPLKEQETVRLKFSFHQQR